jgi:hypothetical protein
VLPVGYFHVVFTLPHELSALVLQNKKEIYPLCCAQHKWYYVEFRIMVSSGDELEQDGGFSMDRPT